MARLPYGTTNPYSRNQQDLQRFSDPRGGHGFGQSTHPYYGGNQSTGGTNPYGGNTGYTSGSVYQGQSSAQSGPAQIAQSRQQILDMTQGRAQEIQDDPLTQAALQRLHAGTTGHDAPITQHTFDQLAAGQGRMAGAQEQAQNQMLRDQMAAAGGSVNDASYQAALRANLGQRQGEVMAMRNQLAADANMRNYDARQQAALGLGSTNLAHQSLVNQPLGMAVDFLGRDAYSQNLGAGLGGGYAPQDDPNRGHVQPYSGFQATTGSAFGGSTQSRSGGASNQPIAYRGRRPQQPQQPQQPTQSGGLFGTGSTAMPEPTRLIIPELYGRP